MYNKSIFREYDIRGIFNEEFDLDFCHKFGLAFANYIKDTIDERRSPIICVGFDARLTSPDIARKIIQGLTQTGTTVFNLGLITTPISYFAGYTLKVDATIMITGSHNPPEYNGLKLTLNKNSFFGNQIRSFKNYFETNSNAFKKNSMVAASRKTDILPKYIKHYENHFNISRPIKVVFDCGNGTAGIVLKDLIKDLNIDAQILFEEPDGNFPNHHPDPTLEENMISLKSKIKETGSDLGIGFDGDSDRLVVVTESGYTLQGDELMTLISREVLKTHPKAKIIGDVKCSSKLYNDISKNGGEPIMWKTGHSLIKAKVKAENSPFGGELSGHIVFADKNFPYDDAIYAALRFIEMFSNQNKSLSELMTSLPKTYSTPEIRTPTTEENVEKTVNYFKEKYLKNTKEFEVNHIDGIRVTFIDDSWALVRASNTQPLVVYRFEASTQKRLEELKSQFLNIEI